MAVTGVGRRICRMLVSWMVIFGLVVLPGCSGGVAEKHFTSAAGNKMVSQVKGSLIAVYQDGKWQSQFWNGVNLGATTPGHNPGELSPTYDDYRRWMENVEELGVNVIRVYTILPPEFYEALVDHNMDSAEKLWFFQGIWSPEEELIDSQDAYLPEITNKFNREIELVCRAVYGQGEIPFRPGNAFGNYTVNTAPYLLGWLLGTEWDPYAVDETIRKNPGKNRFKGKYFYAAPQANPFEAWLASLLEKLAAEEVKTGWQHPVSFVNWVTTDPLVHPDEPFENEDLASVDPKHVLPTEAWEAGYFSSFHVYPYYPDSLRYQLDYQEFIAPDGRKDPYLAYLLDLRQHLDGIPLVIAEFGLPSSRGMAHLGPLGRNQGMHQEKEQGELCVDLFKRIKESGCAGAMLFELNDEWFKFTWNTIDLELPPDRRAMWLNRLTNEEQFGLVANDPGSFTAVLVDGDDRDWERITDKRVLETPELELSLFHDEAYFYLLLKKKDDADWNRERVIIGFDQQPGGNKTVGDLPVSFENGAEFLLVVNGSKEAEMEVASAYDAYRYMWGYKKKISSWQGGWDQENNGIFLPWTLCLSRPLFLPATERQMPIEEINIGRMHYGVSDPRSPEFYSLSDYYIQGRVMEIRIPWMMLGFTDPSSHRVWTYPYREKADEYTTTTSTGVKVEVGIQTGGRGAVKMAAPFYYQWDKWEVPQYHERKKQSFYILKDYFRSQKQ